MPLVAYKSLPSFDRLKEDGHLILDQDRALRQDFRALHIGLLNMMPDAAIEATERQFFRLIGRSDRIVQFYMHPFTIDGIKRGAKAQSHIEQYYETFDEIKEQGLDALIITGANIESSNIEDESFYGPLKDVLDWASKHVTSVLCSCLASHAVMNILYGEKRQPMKDKLWGVFKHKVKNEQELLTRGVNTAFYAPHSRYNQITREQFLKHDMKILAESQDAGVHLASSGDGLKLICFQGHPEYDRITLLKEYKRELLRYIKRELNSRPTLPANYIPAEHINMVEEHIHAVIEKKDIALFDEELILSVTDNTWQDTARSLIQNWLGAVYQVTAYDRHTPYMDDVDPQNPSKSILI